MKDVVCPYCFKTFSQKEVMFRCKSASCPGIDEDPVLKAHWEQYQIQVSKKAPAITPPRKWFSVPEKAVCPECGVETYWMICPHCHNRLDSDFVLKPGKIISIVGSRSCGKTIYITALIEQLKRYGSKMGELGIQDSTVADDKNAITGARFKRDFWTPLFGEGSCPPGTKDDDPYREVPLIYTINQTGQSPLHLVLYDTSGENFQEGKEENIQNNMRFLQNSDAIIFLFDITSIPSIHDGLKERGVPLDIAEYDLQQVVNSLSQQSDIKKRLQKIPKAVVFTKIDLYLDHLTEKLGHIPELNKGQNSPFIDDLGIDFDIIDGASLALQNALLNGVWGPEGSQLLLNFPRNVKSNADVDPLVHFFGVSSLGKSPRDNQVLDSQGRPSVEPFRVLDPLVWILHKFGYKLKTQRK